MNTFLNYLLEANIALVLFMLVYWMLLRKETQFSLKRLYLMAALILSLVLPLIHLQNDFSREIIPSIEDLTSVTMLPTLFIGEPASEQSSSEQSSINPILIAYGLMAVVLMTVFLIRLTLLVKLIIQSKKYRWRNCWVAESEEEKATFSFFHFIFIGQTNGLTTVEKQEILSHELIHVQRGHSFDLLLINLMTIVFWFNPLIWVYKRELAQLHEFEADHESVGRNDIHDYCELLAKVTLQKVNYPMVSPFTSSLTLKRIIMMNTMKNKIKTWKMLAASTGAMFIFLFIGCQEQVVNEISKSTVTQVGNYPPNVAADLKKLKQDFPNQTFTYFEGNREDITKLIDKAGKVDFVRGVYVFKNPTGDVNGVILSNVAKFASDLRVDGEVFTVVEESASPKDGMDKFFEFVGYNLKYPLSARQKGIQGRVFIEFTVKKDGSLSDFNVIKGIGEGCDQEAIRVLQLSPPWNPGKQNHQPINQRYVLPIVFSLGTGNITNISVDNPRPVDEMMKVKMQKSETNGEHWLIGKVENSAGTPMPGVNIVLAGTTTGTVTDMEGGYRLKVDASSGKVVFSFIGFKAEELSF